MFRAIVYHFLRFARYFFWASVLVVMNACVTTTTGGFNVEPSDEESLENYLQLAVAYFDADDMPNARCHLNNALEIDSRNSEAYNILALVSMREGDLELAIENFQRAVRLDRLEEAEVAFTHTPRALLAGITIESRFNKQKLVDDFTRILTTLYQDSPEYAELQQRMTDAN